MEIVLLMQIKLVAEAIRIQVAHKKLRTILPEFETRSCSHH